MELKEAIAKRYIATIVGSKSKKAWYAEKIGQSYQVVASIKLGAWAITEDIDNGGIERLIDPEDCVINHSG